MEYLQKLQQITRLQFSKKQWFRITNDDEFWIDSYDDDGCFFIDGYKSERRRIKIEAIRGVWGFSKNVAISKRFTASSCHTLLPNLEIYHTF